MLNWCNSWIIILKYNFGCCYVYQVFCKYPSLAFPSHMHTGTPRIILESDDI